MFDLEVKCLSKVILMCDFVCLIDYLGPTQYTYMKYSAISIRYVMEMDVFVQSKMIKCQWPFIIDIYL